MLPVSFNAPITPKASRRTPLSELLCEGDRLALIQDLEQRLRNQIEKIEHLKLSMAEVLSSSCNNSGFKSMEQQSGDLEMSLGEHAAFLNDLNERTEALRMSISLFTKVNTTPKAWGERGLRRRNVRAPLWDDTQSEAGWRPRRNSNASEMSCTW